MPHRIRICSVHEFAPGSRRIVAINTFEEALVINHHGKFYAISNSCPHEGAALQRGIIEGNAIYCPLHRWGFDLTTGAYIESKPSLCASIYRVEVNGDDLYLYF
jgi:nitrite reductase/ring-hydroxylating ferredoxin subunit